VGSRMVKLGDMNSYLNGFDHEDEKTSRSMKEIVIVVVCT